MSDPKALWQLILVPVDFSASSNHAAALARDQAVASGGRLVLLHVIELPAHFGPDTTLVLPAGYDTPIGARRFAEIAAGEHLESLVGRLRKDGATVDGFVRVGAPVEEIGRFLDEHRESGRAITAVVMGTHGRTGIRHLVAGSVAERIVRNSRVPVMTIRHPD